MSAPQVAELTNFVGPDENPLSDEGRWTQTVTTIGGLPLMRGSNVATKSSTAGVNYSHYVREVYDTNDGEVQAFGCSEGGQLGAALETWRVCLWFEVGSPRGYLVYFGGGLSKGTVLRRYDASGFTDIAGGGGGYPAKLGIVIDGDMVQGWTHDGTSWTLQCEVSDTNYRGKCHAGLAIEDPTNGGLDFSCFGAGIPRRTQFFRWSRGFKEA